MAKRERRFCVPYAYGYEQLIASPAVLLGWGREPRSSFRSYAAGTGLFGLLRLAMAGKQFTSISKSAPHAATERFPGVWET